MFGVAHSFPVWVFLKSIGAGFTIGFLYFLFMLLRRSGLRQSGVIIIEDILFFSVSAVLTFLFVFDVNAGVGRFYIFAGEGIGFCLFYMFYGKNTAARIDLLRVDVRNRIKNRKTHKKTGKKMKNT